MPLKLMYITNHPAVAKIAEEAGVDRIFIDMETMGKDARQHGMDTVKSNHTAADIRSVKNVLTNAKLLARINPVHIRMGEEIDAAVKNGADFIMLPYWKTADEVRFFLNQLNGRAKSILLLETKEAADCLDQVLEIKGIDEVHIGLNDLHLSLGKRFLFELLADGTVDGICKKLKNAGVPFGFGGFGRIGEGLLPAEKIIAEHYRLGSSMAILSRTFCNTNQITQPDEIRFIFDSGIRQIRQYEKLLAEKSPDFFLQNHKEVKECIEQILTQMKKG